MSMSTQWARLERGSQHLETISHLCDFLFQFAVTGSEVNPVVRSIMWVSPSSAHNECRLVESVAGTRSQIVLFPSSTGSDQTISRKPDRYALLCGNEYG